MPYRIELSPNNRAGCKDKRCKESADKITKGELRFATHYDIGDHQGWAYKHWGCVTPQQLKNLNEYMEGQWELLEGLEDLPDDIQTKIRRACEQGHVDDEDWKWDPEVNRPGARRIIHKKKPAADIGDHEDAANQTVEKAVKTTKAKTKSKKRGRTADDEDAESAEQASPPKKKKTSSKAKVKQEQEQEQERDDAQPKANEKKVRKPQAKPVKEEASVKNEDSDVKEKKLQSKKQVASDAKAAPKTKTKPTKSSKKAAANKAPADTANDIADEAPKPTGRRSRKKT